MFSRSGFSILSSVRVDKNWQVCVGRWSEAGSLRFLSLRFKFYFSA